MTPRERTANEKHQALLGALRPLGRAAAAFSGGVDSTFLLHAARQSLGDEALAVTVVTPYMPEADMEEARNAAKSLGARHVLLEAPIAETIRANPPDRCYLCKRSFFTLMKRTTLLEGISHVLDGANLDDLGTTVRVSRRWRNLA